ncbi:hypothetical protein K3369_20080 [Pseudomonas mandelii]|uniref:hypothetical protein n=1 Tax=Pseudomonas mandelii TaxID=75612 RepID=UPI001C8284D4|nr:hypothetical protein [Pseudomonas mandelii]QZA96057.1 hypothetical protein K3369_20080 [Pseudomonas mandelii]
MATEIRYVMHFSEDSNICAFEPRCFLCWADIVSADFDMIKCITNWVRVAEYKSLYVLRIGLPHEATNLYDSDVFGDIQRNGRGGCGEYALDIHVPQTHFARLDLTPDSTGTFFI